jgi:transposase
MTRERAALSFFNEEVYVGLDVSKNSWKVCIYLGAYYHCRFTQPPKPEILVKYLHKHLPGGRYHCVYEAGCFGFWIHEALSRSGIDCIVVNPSDVPTAHWEKTRKTDPVDAHKLARSLAAHDLRPIYIPERKALEDRSMVRLRSSLVREQTRYKNRIKAILQYYGLTTPVGILDRHWSKNYLNWLDQVRLQHASGDYAFRMLLAQLLSVRELLAELTKKIRILSQEVPYRENVTLLCTIPGVSQLAAMVLLTELIDIRRFKTLDKLASYTGLVPSEHSSGEREIDMGLSYRRNPALRLMLIECAWAAAKRDPALLMCFNRYAGKMPENKAIVKVARKLLSRIRFVLKNNTPYQICTVESVA